VSVRYRRVHRVPNVERSRSVHGPVDVAESADVAVGPAVAKPMRPNAESVTCRARTRALVLAEVAAPLPALGGRGGNDRTAPYGTLVRGCEARAVSANWRPCLSLSAAGTRPARRRGSGTDDVTNPGQHGDGGVERGRPCRPVSAAQHVLEREVAGELVDPRQPRCAVFRGLVRGSRSVSPPEASRPGQVDAGGGARPSTPVTTRSASTTSKGAHPVTPITSPSKAPR
jgi:hypothetical protein